MVVQFNGGEGSHASRREFERIVARKVYGSRLLEDLDGAGRALGLWRGLQICTSSSWVAAVGEGVDGDQGALALGDV